MKATWGIAAALLLVAAAAMDTSAKGRGHKHGFHGHAKRGGSIQSNPLGLSEDQQAQIETLREQHRASFEAILTDEQRAILEERKNPLGLSEDQQAQIQALKDQELTKDEFRTSFAAILTEDQLATIEERKATRGSRTSLSEQLGLSEDQQAQIETLREQHRASIEAILTDEQLAMIEERKANRACQRKESATTETGAAGKATTSVETTSWGRLKDSLGQ